MRRSRIALAMLLGALALPAQALAARDFALRFGTNQPGAASGTANTLMTCPATAAGCTDARVGIGSGAALNNNGYTMTYVDADADPTTFDSSTARLFLPPGAQVLFAGLYYGADTSAGTRGKAAPNGQAAGVVRLRAPSDLTYRTLSANALDTIGTRYQGFVDLTQIVGVAGAGDYTVANVQAGTGEDRYAGWALVVVFGDPAQPVRNISIFDGFQTVSSAQPKVNIPVSGFLAPATGPVRTLLGVVAYEGDRGSTGDSMRLNDTTLSSVSSPPDNFFDSVVESNGTPFTAKDPNYLNQLGFDAGILTADGIVPNSATSAVIRLTTGGETYFPGMVAFATDLYAPRIQPQKSVTDLNGGEVVPGDVLRYTITVPNDGQDGARQVVLRDAIPDRTTFAASGTGVFDATTNTVIFDLGDLAPGQTSIVSFDVKVDDPVPAGTVVVNAAHASFFSQTSGSRSTPIALRSPRSCRRPTSWSRRPTTTWWPAGTAHTTSTSRTPAAHPPLGSSR